MSRNSEYGSLLQSNRKVGTEIFEEHRQYGWVEDGSIFIHDTINNNQMVMCVGTRADPHPSEERRKPVTREILDERFAPWLQGAKADFARGMIDESQLPATITLSLVKRD